MYCFSTMEEFSRIRESVRQKLAQLLVTGAEPLFVAINEAVNNAIFHGNKQDKTKKVYLTIKRLPGEIQVVIRDEGQGFTLVENKIEEGLPEGGRGLEIIGLCVDKYYFNVQPSELVLIKKVSGFPVADKRKVIKKGRLVNVH